MMFYLDHLIFGNGYGLASPNCDGVFYWLKDRRTNKAELYTYRAGFGAQLCSFQWSHPLPGERRIIQGFTFTPFLSERRWGRVQVHWRMTRLGKGIEEDHRQIRALKIELDRL